MNGELQYVMGYQMDLSKDTVEPVGNAATAATEPSGNA